MHHRPLPLISRHCVVPNIVELTSRCSTRFCGHIIISAHGQRSPYFSMFGHVSTKTMKATSKYARSVHRPTWNPKTTVRSSSLEAFFVFLRSIRPGCHVGLGRPGVFEPHTERSRTAMDSEGSLSTRESPCGLPQRGGETCHVRGRGELKGVVRA